LADLPGPRDVDPADLDAEVPGPSVDEFELVAEVGEEPPEAIERTEQQVLRANGT
jgi:hypothetical protein